MSTKRGLQTLFYRIPSEAVGPALDILGPTAEFLVGPAEDDDTALCILRGVVPAGVVVPMHSHKDAEDFYILSGTQEVLTQRPGGLEWAHAQAGDYVHVPTGTMHAHRNVYAEPAVDLIITTAKMGRFLQEVGIPVTGEPPAPERMAHLAETSAKYGFTLATPEENAAVGIVLPPFPG